MAGGGVGEAMLIGAAVGAGTGGVMSAVQDKDVGQGMLLGALGGAATGGIGAGLGGTAANAVGTTAVETGAENVAGNVATNAGENIAANAVESGVTNPAVMTPGIEAPQGAFGTSFDTAQGLTPAQSGVSPTQMAGPPAPNWGMMGKGEGVLPGMTNAQVTGAATTGGISGLVAANGQPAPYEAPGTEPYTGPLSKFKMAGPQLNQYSYSPTSFQPSVAPGYAEGGIAGLAQGGVQQTGMFPQSQMDRTQFATPTQMPVSREIIGSDYDATINPYTGDLPRFADGGGINFIHNLQPGGEFGDITADMYGAVQEHKPQWLQDMEPGGFIGATVPGKLDWEEKKRKEEEEKIAQDRAAKEAMQAKMYNDMAQQGKMARGGIADLGSYSDGGRLLRGPGDGMSDNIPATIAGKQPARLADGEFVVPADVVSGLGNGSTDAGAKTLYSMMNKVRKARTGTTRQGKEIHAEKYVPKMASGGIASYANGGQAQGDGALNWPVEGQDGSYVNTTDVLNQSGISNPFVASASPAYMPSVYTPDARYNAYTIANRPSSTEPQFYGNIYRGEIPDYSTPGYTLTGGNLGRWSNVAGERQRAMQPASTNQQITQAYLQNLGRAPDTDGFNAWMQKASTPVFDESLYLQQKLNQLKGTPQAKQFANYTPEQLKDYINNAAGMTLQQHYNLYGKNEGLTPYSSGVQNVVREIATSPEAQTTASSNVKNKKRRGGIASLV